MSRRIFAAILAALMLSGALAACSTAPTEEETTAADTTAAPEDTKLLPNLPEANFDGYEFKILTGGQYESHWISRDVYAAETNGEPINDAVFARNMLIESTYGVKIVEKTDTDFDCSDLATNTVLAGEDAFDLGMFRFGTMSKMAAQSLMVNLSQIEHIDLSQPWYDSYANDAFSIAGKQYLTMGDLNILDNEATWSIFFNKRLAKDLDLGNLYQLVLDGKWTLDKLGEYAAVASIDLNGDGVHDVNDQWGLQGEGFNCTAYINGCDISAYAKDKNDIPYITAGEERYYDAFVKMVENTANFDTCMYAENLRAGYTNVFTELIDPSYIGGRVLFTCVGLNRTRLFRDMEDDFGVLPIPKYDEEQELYRCLVSGSGSTFGVFKTAQNTSRTGLIVEALSAESMYTLTPAYYEQTLKLKESRDEQSSAMLDLILNTRAFDMGSVHPTLNSLFNMPATLAKEGSLDLASQLATLTPAAEAAIDALVEAYQKTE